MQEETNHLYELANKEEKELKEKLMEEFKSISESPEKMKSIGKPEMWNDVQQYAIDFLLRTTWERLKGL